MSHLPDRIPPDYIRECFDIDANGVLYWKRRPAHHATTPWTRARMWGLAGKRAGHIGSAGYYVLSLTYRGDLYKIANHRIVWLLTNGDWPKQVIDHINRVRTDNRPANLRDVSNAENLRNTGRPPRALPIGVLQAASGRFVARIVHGRKCYHLGTFDTPQQAGVAYLLAAAAA